jgi:hypothetical protein
MPQPTLPVPTMQFKGIEKFLQELDLQSGTIQAGVASVGEAAAYSLVWEFGNARQVKQGPKTVRGHNIQTGETVWLSIQAPFGYVRISENLYWEALRQEMGRITFQGNTARAIEKEMEDCLVRVATTISKIIAEHAPVDKGTLEDSFVVIKPGNSLLDEQADYVLDIGGE